MKYDRNIYTGLPVERERQTEAKRYMQTYRQTKEYLERERQTETKKYMQTYRQTKEFLERESVMVY